MFLRLIALSIFIVGSAAHAQIYRCELDDTVVFSDTPCSADAVSHAPTGTLSIIPTSGDLDQVAEANSAFIQAQLARQAANRQARQRKMERQQAAAVRPAPPPRPHPVMVLPRQRHAPGQHPPHRKQASAEEEHSRQQPFSALSGPWPGSRRPPRTIDP